MAGGARAEASAYVHCAAATSAAAAAAAALVLPPPTAANAGGGGGGGCGGKPPWPAAGISSFAALKTPKRKTKKNEQTHNSTHLRGGHIYVE
jgi:hypothetical protein